jgi:hypothetical protein
VSHPQAIVRRSQARSAQPSDLVLDRYARAFFVVAGALVVVGGIVAAVNSASPFPHGSWLAAYLVLVGGASQVALGGWRLGLRQPRPAPRTIGAQLILWNFGVVCVPSGVLAGARGLVSIGSFALLSALTLYALETRRWRPSARKGTFLYLAIVGALGVSVVVGSALADAAPGAWL